MRERIQWILMLAMTALIFNYGSGPTQAEEAKKGITAIPSDQLTTRIVEIRSEKGLSPKTLVSGKGTTVVWYNASHGSVKIRFDRGDQVKMACADPLHFNLQPEGIFQSEEIPLGGTASLCFIEPGDYAYTLTGSKVQAYPTQRGEFVELGTILVK
ncbi:MAG: hypothetical protein HYY20_14160 [Candidatus Tectomicrobia bacterium]|uniref:Uncharacterized protein n=1 Tax=Tectimicrobiota bacterium TaxID=2528274 RepID=A0A932CSX8_UNCTE|nr:hypothetical protein [Candidatus Tectomicrobia bacterium]